MKILINTPFLIGNKFKSTLMKTILLSFIGSFLLSATTPSTVSDVYICNGPKSTKYHLDSQCKGLTKCSTEIEKLTLEKAKAKGRTLCGYED